jgi:hypothetical protein
MEMINLSLNDSTKHKKSRLYMKRRLFKIIFLIRGE